MNPVETAFGFVGHVWALTKDAAPWLLAGLAAAGLIRALIPAGWMSRWLGRRGIGSVLRAGLIGTPLPLCSCAVLPAALGLRRHGASRGATVSFLVATPENGADSIALSYVLLGPFMTVARPVASLLSAIAAGSLSEFATRHRPDGNGEAPPASAAAAAAPMCSAGCAADPAGREDDAAGPSDARSPDSDRGQTGPASIGRRVAEGMRYAMTDILDDLAVWLAIGIVLAAAVSTLVPSDAMAAWGGGLPAMLAMLLVGLPMYICATASTPVAASLLAAGLSPGTVLVFLLAGPATNIGTIAVIRRELGARTMWAYLIGVCGGAVASGLATDALAGAWGFDITTQAAEARRLMPPWLAASSAVLLIVLAIRPVRRTLFRLVRGLLQREATSAPPPEATIAVRDRSGDRTRRKSDHQEGLARPEER